MFQTFFVNPIRFVFLQETHGVFREQYGHVVFACGEAQGNTNALASPMAATGIALDEYDHFFMPHLIQRDKSVTAFHQIGEHNQAAKHRPVVYGNAVSLRAVGAKKEPEPLLREPPDFGGLHVFDPFVDEVKIHPQIFLQGGFDEPHCGVQIAMRGRCRKKDAEFLFYQNRSPFRRDYMQIGFYPTFPIPKV